MSIKNMTLTSFVAPSFNKNYPTTTWSAKRAYAHFGATFGKRPIGVNG